MDEPSALDSQARPKPAGGPARPPCRESQDHRVRPTASMRPCGSGHRIVLLQPGPRWFEEIVAVDLPRPRPRRRHLPRFVELKDNCGAGCVCRPAVNVIRNRRLSTPGSRSPLARGGLALWELAGRLAVYAALPPSLRWLRADGAGPERQILGSLSISVSTLRFGFAAAALLGNRGRCRDGPLPLRRARGRAVVSMPARGAGIVFVPVLYTLFGAHG